MGGVINMDDEFDWHEYHKFMKQRSQDKRASNRENSAAYPDFKEIVYQEKNNGAHLVVEGNEGYIDFWPGTGRWIDRASGTKGFGVRNLVNFIVSPKVPVNAGGDA